MVSQVAKKCILVAEDDRFCQMALGAIMKAAGATATMTDDGLKCVQELAANPTKYHMVLMDIFMPVMDGYSATVEIRKVNKGIKIVGLSSEEGEDVRQQALRCGMNGIVTKPVKKSELVSLIKTG